MEPLLAVAMAPSLTLNILWIECVTCLYICGNMRKKLIEKTRDRGRERHVWLTSDYVFSCVIHSHTTAI